MPPDTQVAENTARLASPSDAKELSKVDPRPQPRSNVGKARTKRPPVSYAQRPDVGAYGPWTLDQQDARIRDSFAQLVPLQQRQGHSRREVRWAQTEHTRRPHFGWFDTGW